MEDSSENAPQPNRRSGSEQALLDPTGPRGGSNGHALKIAGITTLVCLLVSAQVFTAYLVFDQKQQIQGLQMNNQKMQRQMSQPSRAMPQKMVMPIGSLPLLDFSEGVLSPKSTPKPDTPKVEVAAPSLEKQLQELIKDDELPQMKESFLDNLKALKQNVSETDWKSFESWMRYWLIFQKAQKTPTPDATQ